MIRHKVKLDLDATGGGLIEVDGRPLHGVTGITVTSKAKHITRVELQLAVWETSAELDAEVLLPQRTRDTLVALGWTPPEPAE